MIEFNPENSAAAAAPNGFAVSVIGIGGAGMNVIDKIALDGMPGADLICMNCDVRALTSSMAGRKVQLGRSLTQGLGCGGDPELGQEAAESSDQEIRDLLAGRSMVFICTGLGGGTGSGAAPQVARIARETGAFVVVFATLPFSFEGRRRMNQGLQALQSIRRFANALVTFENDRMGELVVPKKGVQEAFDLADKIIGQSVRAVTSVVTQPGLIHIGMDDLIAALRNTDSRCLFGFGQAKGENRAAEALALAMKSPLLDRGQMLSSARNVLVHICGGETLTLFEIETLMKDLSRHVSEDAQILFGAAVDAKLNEHVSVTLITSLNHAPPGAPVLEAPGSENTLPESQPESAATAPPEPAVAAATPESAPSVAAHHSNGALNGGANGESYHASVAPVADFSPRHEPVAEDEPAVNGASIDYSAVPAFSETAPAAPAFENETFAQPAEEAFEESPAPVVAAAPAAEADQWVAAAEFPEPNGKGEYPIDIEYAAAEQEYAVQNGMAAPEQSWRRPDEEEPAQDTMAEEFRAEQGTPSRPEPERLVRVDRAAAAAIARPVRHFPSQPEYSAAPRKRFTLSEVTRRPVPADSALQNEAEQFPASTADSRTAPLPHIPAADHGRLAPIRPIAATSPPRLASRQQSSPPVLGQAHLSRPPADASAARPVGAGVPARASAGASGDPQAAREHPHYTPAPAAAGAAQGHFEQAEPTVEEGEDLDVPTFLRRKP